ncbi:MAG: histone deacetylase family protein, partial [Rhizobiales bacterium]|nr:histone deacetylase family protein [Hyphomicrobiales bacterium]
MITVFDETQRRHAPRDFVVSGKPQPIPERPERIDMLLEGVRCMAGPVVAPPAISAA